MNKAFKGWEMRWEMPQKVRATALTKPKNVLLCNLGTEHLFLFGSVKIYAWNYWITDTLIVLNSIPAVISLLFFSKRKGGKDILRFPIKGDDSVNRVNNSVVELSGKYSLSMIVDKTWSLQMGVANRSSEELETSFFHIFTHGIGFGGGYRNLAQWPECVDNRLFVGKEWQGIIIKTAEFLLYGKE